MSTFSVSNFSLLDAASTTINATPTTSRIELSNPGPPQVMVVNNTTTTIFVRTGNSLVVADANAMPILPGEKGVYSRGNTLGETTHLAAFATVGAADLIVLEGSGS